MSHLKLDAVDEEFTNFMHKVTQVSNIVEKLVSSDKKLQEIGDLEAKEYLGENKEQIFANIDEKDLKLKIKDNRTVLNRKAILHNEDPNTQSQEAFMEEISKDADRRYKDKLIRKERMETIKKQGNLAFRRGEFEKALSLYNKAIEQIRDSPLLYLNRATTYLHLKFYDKVIDDCKTALKLNEDSLKGWMLMAKAYFLTDNFKEFANCIQEAKSRNPKENDFINDFATKLKITD